MEQILGHISFVRHIQIVPWLNSIQDLPFRYHDKYYFDPSTVHIGGIADRYVGAPHHGIWLPGGVKVVNSFYVAIKISHNAERILLECPA